MRARLSISLFVYERTHPRFGIGIFTYKDGYFAFTDKTYGPL